MAPDRKSRINLRMVDDWICDYDNGSEEGQLSFLTSEIGDFRIKRSAGFDAVCARG